MIRAEMDVQTFIKKVKKAQLKGIWIRIAEGRSRHENAIGKKAKLFTDIVKRLRAAKVDVWGWHVPHCATEEAAREEAALIGERARGPARPVPLGLDCSSVPERSEPLADYGDNDGSPWGRQK